MNIWQKVLQVIKKDVTVPTYNMWFQTSELISETDDRIVVSVPTEFAKDWLQSKYYGTIQNILHDITGRSFDVTFIIRRMDVPLETPEEQPASTQVLNPKYTFDSFVVGNSNKFAHAACLACAKNPGRAYNPLFIYGGVGLGKTHLLQAIGHDILSKQPQFDLIYTTTERFTTEVISAIKQNKVSDFHEYYRTVQVLLIDDIQFLADKERTQEEFFHLFNVLYDKNRQIVITSDRPPKELKGIADRLRSRFEMGLLADIQQPDLETRIAILQTKASQEHISIPQEVINYIATHNYSNIRELEGALIRLVAIASLQNEEITLQMARNSLKDIIPKTSRQITVRQIINETARYFNIPSDELINRRRTHDIAIPRQIAMYLAREYTGESLVNIGENFGGRDHTTIMYAHDKIAGQRKSDQVVDTAIVEILSVFEQN
jgi:chromosomal replication initiator protein